MSYICYDKNGRREFFYNVSEKGILQDKNIDKVNISVHVLLSQIKIISKQIWEMESGIKFTEILCFDVQKRNIFNWV